MVKETWSTPDFTTFKTYDGYGNNIPVNVDSNSINFITTPSSNITDFTYGFSPTYVKRDATGGRSHSASTNQPICLTQDCVLK